MNAPTRRTPPPQVLIIIQTILCLIGFGLVRWEFGSFAALNLDFSKVPLVVGLCGAIPLVLYSLIQTSDFAFRNPPFSRVFRSFALGPVGSFLNWANLIWIILFSLVAAVGEEILFRSFVQEKFGLIVASISFGLVHFVTLPFSIIMTLFGFYQGWIYSTAHNSVIAPIISHLIYNLVGMLILKRKLKLFTPIGPNAT